MVLGTIILSFAQLSRKELGSLLRLESDVNLILADLHSVLLIPKGDSPVQVFHQSFQDFLTSPTRCTDPRFLITPLDQHGEIARCCLDRMISLLKRDICDIRNPSKLYHEIDDLEQRKRENLPGDLRYACLHWAGHLKLSPPSESLAELCQTFIFKYLLYWVEALSLMGRLEEVTPIVKSAQNWTKVGQNSF